MRSGVDTVEGPRLIPGAKHSFASEIGEIDLACVFLRERKDAGCPARHIMDDQQELYMTYRKKDRPELAGAKAGFSPATACRI